MGVMKIRNKGLMALLPALVLPIQAEAQKNNPTSGNVLLAGCKAAHSYEYPSGIDYVFANQMGICSGVVRAILELKGFLAICAPEGVSLGQGIRVVVKYMDQRPEVTHGELTLIAVEALQKAWPCGGQNRKQLPQ